MGKRKTIYFITGNLNKLVEARKLLPEYHIENYSINLPEIQGDRIDVIKNKIKYAVKVLNKPIFVEDTCLCYSALKGLPGPYIKDFYEKLGNTGLFNLVKGFQNKNAKAICSIGFGRPGKDPIIFDGITLGKIVSPRGGLDFGWSPVFLPRGSKKTYGQMTLDEKNKVSFRKKAFVKFHQFLHENNL